MILLEQVGAMPGDGARDPCSSSFVVVDLQALFRSNSRTNGGTKVATRSRPPLERPPGAPVTAFCVRPRGRRVPALTACVRPNLRPSSLANPHLRVGRSAWSACVSIVTISKPRAELYAKRLPLGDRRNARLAYCGSDALARPPWRAGICRV